MFAFVKCFITAMITIINTTSLELDPCMTKTNQERLALRTQNDQKNNSLAIIVQGAESRPETPKLAKGDTPRFRLPENTPMHKGHMGTCRNGVRTLQWKAWFPWGWEQRRPG